MIGFTRTMYVCLFNKPIELYHSRKHYASFLNSLQFYQHNKDSRSRAFYGVEKLPDNWNVYKKDSSRPKLTICLPRVENMVAYILWWLAIIFMSKVFV